VPTSGTRPQLLQRLANIYSPRIRRNGYKRPQSVHAFKQGAALLVIDLPLMLTPHPAVRNTRAQVHRTQDLNSAIQAPSLNQLLGPGPTGVYHPVVSTTIDHTYPAVGITRTVVSHPAMSTLVPHTYPAVGITHTEVSHPAVSTLVPHTYSAVGITHTEVSHPAVSTLLPHTYSAVGIIHTEVFHPAVSTLVIYTCPAGNVNLVGVTRTLESDAYTTEVQTALILRLPHHITPPLSRQLQHAIRGGGGKYVSFSKLLLPHNAPPLINPIKQNSTPKR
jgi:hypothetical protein